MMNQSAQPTTDRLTAAPDRTGGLESFDCYRLTIEFAVLAAALVPRGHGALRDQLERASTSVALNLAEGFGRWQARDKVHLYTIARGSLLESGAAIDLLRTRGLPNEADCGRVRELCTRVDGTPGRARVKSGREASLRAAGRAAGESCAGRGVRCDGREKASPGGGCALGIRLTSLLRMSYVLGVNVRTACMCCSRTCAGESPRS